MTSNYTFTCIRYNHFAFGWGFLILCLNSGSLGKMDFSCNYWIRFYVWYWFVWTCWQFIGYYVFQVCIYVFAGVYIRISMSYFLPCRLRYILRFRENNSIHEAMFLPRALDKQCEKLLINDEHLAELSCSICLSSLKSSILWDLTMIRIPIPSQHFIVGNWRYIGIYIHIHIAITCTKSIRFNLWFWNVKNPSVLCKGSLAAKVT